MRASECIIDIGSGSIGICLTEFEKEKPVLSKTTRVPLPLGAGDAAASLPNLAMQAVQKALESLKGVPPPKHVRIILASPWYNAKIRTIVSKSEKPVRVTTATVARSVKEYMMQKNEASSASGRTKIESVVSQAYVNGYPTPLQRPMSGTALKINYYESEADSAFLSTLSETVKNAFPHAELSFHSFSLVACLVLRLVRKENNFIMLDVGGELTEVVIAHHDGLRFVGTFPVGTRSITRSLAGNKGVSDALSRLALYAKDELSLEEKTAFSAAFESATAEWHAGYQMLLEEAVKEVAIPQTTFVFGDAEELKWLPVMIGVAHGAFSTRSLPMEGSTFQEFVNLEEGALYDPFLSLESIFFHTRKRDLIEL